MENFLKKLLFIWCVIYDYVLDIYDSVLGVRLNNKANEIKKAAAL